MRLLLTGATGFVGRHVVQAADGWTVCAMKRKPAAWTQNDFAAALDSFSPEMVLHCAGTMPGSPPAANFATNAVLAADLLAAIAASEAKPRLILVGSAAEYGIVPASALPVAETHVCAPRTAYAVSKYAQTLLGLAAHTPVLVARLFNPVGVGMPSGLALPSFARRIVAAGQHGTMVVGDLSARRDFIDVAEAARLLLGLAALPDWPWPVINLCSGRAYSMAELLGGLLAASGHAVTVQTDPRLLRPGDMPVLVGSTHRLVKAGLAPRAPNFPSILPRILAEAQEASQAA